jgi:hypothetical protein
MALIVSEFERGGFNFEAVDKLHETAPVGAAAELAVGYHLQTDLLLKGDNIANALILQFAEFCSIDLVSGIMAKSLAQDWRPQQASDVVGAKWWAAWHACGHAGRLLEVISIAQ